MSYIYQEKLNNLTIKIIRGIKCINTFPDDLVWGKKNTVLECSSCIKYASCPITKILIGLCHNCAYDYNGKYGCGYYMNLQDNNMNNMNNMNEIPRAFGDLHTIDVLDKLIHISLYNEYTNMINNYKDVFSIYNLFMLSTNDIHLLLEKHNYGILYFKEYYNCDYEVLNIIINSINELKLEYNNLTKSEILFNETLYKKCIDIENFYKVNNTCSNSSNIHSSNNNNHNNIIIKYNCNYCYIRKASIDMKKCSGCKMVRYCSIACQTRDWKLKHNYSCLVYRNQIHNENGIFEDYTESDYRSDDDVIDVIYVVDDVEVIDVIDDDDNDDNDDVVSRSDDVIDNDDNFIDNDDNVDNVDNVDNID